MPPNTLRVHTEYVFVKSMVPKVLWVVAAEATSAGGWRMFPSPPVVEVEISGVAIYRKEVQPVSQAPVTCIVLKAKGNDRRTSSPLPRWISWASI
ncbi:hypothetical protein TNCV_2154431 [Trichonephila clavipes]|nr:hypothetical protein TNCV_2154431 [Trichonephila clavipes]